MLDPLVSEMVSDGHESSSTEGLRPVAGSRHATVRPGIPGRELLKFAGVIEAEDLWAMSRAIEEDCERVSLDEG